MSQSRPWEGEWKVEDDNFGCGGQGTTQLVSRIAEPHEQGVLKVLKKQKSVKARLRMHREVTNLRTLAKQGLKVPRVLAANSDENEDPVAVLYFGTSVFRCRPGRTESGSRAPVPGSGPGYT